MSKFQKVRQVTLPIFKLDNNKEYYFRIDCPIYVGKQLDDKKAPAHITHVTNLETGELGMIIVPTVLEKELIENYGDAYVGKGFEIVKHLPKENKNYSTFALAEVAIPDDIAAPPIPQAERPAEVSKPKAAAKKPAHAEAA